MLYVDPSESRYGSRLPDSVLERATELAGLEERTGGDILISPLPFPAASDNLLLRHCQAGLLVQRKSGQDLVNSITNGRLARSLLKMLGWTSRPWLVICARIDHHGDRATLDGREGLGYTAVLSALDWWQLRGGYLTILNGDGDLPKWLGGWLDKLRAISEEPIKILTRNPQQALAEDLQMSFLMALPGVGAERAKALLKAAGSPLAALQALVNGSLSIEGIGQGTRESVREWLSMGQGRWWRRLGLP